MQCRDDPRPARTLRDGGDEAVPKGGRIVLEEKKKERQVASDGIRRDLLNHKRERGLDPIVSKDLGVLGEEPQNAESRQRFHRHRLGRGGGGRNQRIRKNPRKKKRPPLNVRSRDSPLQQWG